MDNMGWIRKEFFVLDQEAERESISRLYEDEEYDDDDDDDNDLSYQDNYND